MTDNKQIYNNLHETLYKGHPEYPKYLLDFNKYPLWNNDYKDVYRGIPYTIRRIRGLHLCGYVHPNKVGLNNFTEEEFDKIQLLSHFEFTAEWGFDCHHYTDYAPLPIFFNTNINEEDKNKLKQIARNIGINSKETYKDFDYVRKTIINIINKIIEFRPNFTPPITDNAN